jgi:hypothetical protein
VEISPVLCEFGEKSLFLQGATGFLGRLNVYFKEKKQCREA